MDIVRFDGDALAADRVSAASRGLSFQTASQLPTSDQPISAGTTAACLVRSITA